MSWVTFQAYESKCKPLKCIIIAGQLWAGRLFYIQMEELVFFI